jgi:hypothetical protein
MKHKVKTAQFRLYARIRSWLLKILRRIDSFIWNRRYPKE